MADLGKTDLQECLNVDAASAKDDPQNIAVQDGHVYLLKSSYQHRNILFRVSLRPNEGPLAGGAADAGNPAPAAALNRKSRIRAKRRSFKPRKDE